MSSRRLVRVNELLKREIANELFRVMHESGFDLSAVTITRVNVSPNLRHARVSVSIRDHEGERQQILRLIESHRKTIQQHLNKNTTLKYTPHLEFQLDESIEKGDRILAIISEMEQSGDIVVDEQTPEGEEERQGVGEGLPATTEE